MINKFTSKKIYKTLIKLGIKTLFLEGHYMIKTNIISYNLLPNSPALKLCNQKDEYIAVQN